MNSLSWIIYLAGVSQSISVLLGFAAVLTLFGLVFFGIVYEFSNDFMLAARKWIFIAAGCAIVAALIPSKESIYAIAASEYGEEVLKTPEASKARKALNSWLDAQIKEQKPEK